MYFFFTLDIHKPNQLIVYKTIQKKIFKINYHKDQNTKKSVRCIILINAKIKFTDTQEV